MILPTIIKESIFFSSHIRQPLFLLCLENTASGRYKTINEWFLHFLSSYIYNFTFPSYISFINMLLIWFDRDIGIFQVLSHIAYFFTKYKILNFKTKNYRHSTSRTLESMTWVCCRLISHELVEKSALHQSLRKVWKSGGMQYLP